MSREKAIDLFRRDVVETGYMQQTTGTWDRIIQEDTDSPTASASTRNISRRLADLLRGKGYALPGNRWHNSGSRADSDGAKSMAILQHAVRSGDVSADDVLDALKRAAEDSASVAGSGIDVSAFLPKKSQTTTAVKK